MPREFDPDQPEMMDLPQPVSKELERDLDNLVSLNRWFGSHRLLLHFLRRWWRPGGEYRVLDLCTGAGDLPRLMVDFARSIDARVRIVALDANPATIEIARRRSQGYTEINFVEGNALTYGAPAEFDFVHCALALHHFSDSDAARLLTRCRILSARWVLAADLERSPFTTFAVWLLTALIYSEPMTRHDGRLSARRAFSFAELRELAGSAGWIAFGHARFAFGRQAAWIDGSVEPDEVCLPVEVCPG
jgi:SAM-dependent methyltransferase